MAKILAAPTLTIKKIAGQDVAAGQDATVSPPGPWLVEGGVTHGTNKPVTAMWYMIDGNFPGFIQVPAGAASAGTTTEVAFSFTLGSADISGNLDYHLLVIAQNADGPTNPAVARTIHGVGFPVIDPGTGGSTGPGTELTQPPLQPAV